MNTMNPVAYGLIVAVIGIAVVFVMLTILIAFVWALGKLMQKLVNRAEAKKAAAAAAAIAAFDNSGKNLVVRKVRRVSGWKDAARSEQIYHF